MINSPSSRANKKDQVAYAKLFSVLLKKLNEGLYGSKKLNDAISDYNKVISNGEFTSPYRIQEEFENASKKMLDETEKTTAPKMSSAFFPALAKRNQEKWMRSMRSQGGVKLAVKVEKATSKNAKKELAIRLGDNTSRINAWSKDHYSAFQNSMTEAIRMAENTGVPINTKAIAEKAIKDGSVPPNKRSKNRAALIARDQTSKFNAAVSRGRSRDLGSSYYQWNDSSDGRVRKLHLKFDQLYFNLEGKEVTRKGILVPGGINTNGIMPGDEVNCRCFARWVINFKS